MVWKLRTHEGRPVYVYLLLEFQSTVDRFMAVREAELYLDLIARGEIKPDPAGCPWSFPTSCSMGMAAGGRRRTSQSWSSPSLLRLTRSGRV